MLTGASNSRYSNVEIHILSFGVDLLSRIFEDHIFGSGIIFEEYGNFSV